MVVMPYFKEEFSFRVEVHEQKPFLENKKRMRNSRERSAHLRNKLMAELEGKSYANFDDLNPFEYGFEKLL